jgi:DNA (cytosine-5)-methyltransferase 1
MRNPLVEPTTDDRIHDASLTKRQTSLTSIELCAGAGGQALGLYQAGFSHLALVDNDPHCVATLKQNFTASSIYLDDLRTWNAKPFERVDLLAAGLPCPPFSKAGKQLGSDDERNLFPITLEIIAQIKPRAIMIENVPGLMDLRFYEFRSDLETQLEKMGYVSTWQILNASNYGVSQLRPRVVFLALHKNVAPHFSFPPPSSSPPLTVGEALHDLMAEKGWRKVNEWKKKANRIAPTLVGGSKKHGGPDLGPTRAKKAWASLAVNGHLIAASAPEPDFDADPYLTVKMCARLQGFPDEWSFFGRKTASYRQVGNAFPPPVAEAVGRQLFRALEADKMFTVRCGRSYAQNTYK